MAIIFIFSYSFLSLFSYGESQDSKLESSLIEKCRRSRSTHFSIFNIEILDPLKEYEESKECWANNEFEFGKKSNDNNKQPWKNQHQSRLINSILFIFVIELEKYNQSNEENFLFPMWQSWATLNVTLIIFSLCHSAHTRFHIPASTPTTTTSQSQFGWILSRKLLFSSKSD